MRKLSRTDPSLDFIRPFAEFCKDGSRSHAPEVIREFGERVIQGLTASVDKPHRRAGIQAELLFQTVVAALGDVKMLKAEDSGDVFFDGDEDISIPDFTVVTKAGARLLVEVKLAGANDDDYKLSDNLMQSYIRYAEAMGGVLLFAVFWQHYGNWTLNSVAAFTPGAIKINKWSLNYFRALATNEFYQLGDALIATTPPFRFRVHCKPIPMPEGVGDFQMLIEASHADVLWCSQVLQGTTRDLAWTLMYYGGWTEVSKTGIVRDGILYGFDHVIAPPHSDEDETPGFWHDGPDENKSRGLKTSVIAALSSLISRAYLDGAYSTIHTNSLDKLLEPGACQGLIPHDIEIPLARLTCHPNYEVEVEDRREGPAIGSRRRARRRSLR